MRTGSSPRPRCSSYLPRCARPGHSGFSSSIHQKLAKAKNKAAILRAQAAAKAKAVEEAKVKLQVKLEAARTAASGAEDMVEQLRRQSLAATAKLVGANPEWTASGESLELVPEQANAKGEGFVSWVGELGKSENYAKLLECLRPGGRAPLLIGLPLALPLLSPVWAVEMRS